MKNEIKVSTAVHYRTRCARGTKTRETENEATRKRHKTLRPEYRLTCTGVFLSAEHNILFRIAYKFGTRTDVRTSRGETRRTTAETSTLRRVFFFFSQI